MGTVNISMVTVFLCCVISEGALFIAPVWTGLSIVLQDTNAQIPPKANHPNFDFTYLNITEPMTTENQGTIVIKQLLVNVFSLNNVKKGHKNK